MISCSLVKVNRSVHTSPSTTLSPTSSAPCFLVIALSTVTRCSWKWWSCYRKASRSKGPSGHRYHIWHLLIKTTCPLSVQCIFQCGAAYHSCQGLCLDTKWIQIFRRCSCSTLQFYNSFPLLMKYLPGPHQTVQHIWSEVKDFIRGEVKEHKQNWDPSDQRDYIDCYLNEIQMVSDTKYWVLSLMVSCLQRWPALNIALHFCLYVKDRILPILTKHSLLNMFKVSTAVQYRLIHI